MEGKYLFLNGPFLFWWILNQTRLQIQKKKQNWPKNVFCISHTFIARSVLDEIGYWRRFWCCRSIIVVSKSNGSLAIATFESFGFWFFGFLFQKKFVFVLNSWFPLMDLFALYNVIAIWIVQQMNSIFSVPKWTRVFILFISNFEPWVLQN